MRKILSLETGRPYLPPGVYFRTLLVGFFEGIGERGIAWRVADRLSLRQFLKYVPRYVSY